MGINPWREVRNIQNYKFCCQLCPLWKTQNGGSIFNIQKIRSRIMGYKGAIIKLLEQIDESDELFLRQIYTIIIKHMEKKNKEK